MPELTTALGAIYRFLAQIEPTLYSLEILGHDRSNRTMPEHWVNGLELKLSLDYGQT